MFVGDARSGHFNFEFRFEFVEVSIEGRIFHLHSRQGVSGARGSVCGNKFFHKVHFDFFEGSILVFDVGISAGNKPSFGEGFPSSLVHFVEECKDLVFLQVESWVEGEVSFHLK